MCSVGAVNGLTARNEMSRHRRTLCIEAASIDFSSFRGFLVTDSVCRAIAHVQFVPRIQAECQTRKVGASDVARDPRVRANAYRTKARFFTRSSDIKYPNRADARKPVVGQVRATLAQFDVVAFPRVHLVPLFLKLFKPFVVVIGAVRVHFSLPVGFATVVARLTNNARKLRIIGGKRW